jgi:hypothetical protein
MLIIIKEFEILYDVLIKILGLILKEFSLED